MSRWFSITVLALVGLIAGAGSVCAQQDGRVYRIGYLWFGTPEGTPSERLPAFRDGMRERGYVEGKNLVIDVRDGRGNAARLATEAASLAAAGVDVIVTAETGPTVAAMQATNRIPIVFSMVGDPVGRRLVASLAHPGGNVTGRAIDLGSNKGYEALREIAPRMRRIGLLFNASNFPAAYLPTLIAGRKAAAEAVGFELIPLPIVSFGEFGPAFAELAKGGGEAIFVQSNTLFTTARGALFPLALQYRLASVCNDPLTANAGCLITYADDFDEGSRHAAVLAGKILKGAKPADLPVEQPTHFKLIINLKTAKALGLTIPPSILARADEVIE